MSFIKADPDDMVKRLRGLRLQLAEQSLRKHGMAIDAGHDTLTGSGFEGQSYAYANASSSLELLIREFENVTGEDTSK